MHVCICICSHVPCVPQVYECLEDIFSACPYPIPLSAILLHCNITADKNISREATLQQLVRRFPPTKYGSTWRFEAARLRSTDRRTYYAFKDGVTTVPLKIWKDFLKTWTPQDLDVMSRLIMLSSPADMTVGESSLLARVREWHEVLMVSKEAPFAAWKARLKELDKIGLINLSLITMGARNTPFSKLQADRRSMNAQLRESRKREANLQRKIELEVRRSAEERDESERRIAQLQRRIKLERREGKKRESILQQKLQKTEAALARAEKKLAEFRIANPDWTEPDNVDLNRDDSRSFSKAFTEVDKSLDVELQLKHDPSGALTTFWAEQRRRLHVNKRAKWNPQV